MWSFRVIWRILVPCIDFLYLRHFLDLMYTVLEGALVCTINRSASDHVHFSTQSGPSAVRISHNNQHLPGRIPTGTRPTDRNMLPSSSLIVVDLLSTQPECKRTTHALITLSWCISGVATHLPGETMAQQY